MPTDFGSTPLSTTTIGANQFPISAGYVPGQSGNLNSIQLGPLSTDGGGYASAPIATYTPDGNSITLGTTTDLSSANTLIGLTKAIKANTASVTIGTLPTLPMGSNTIGNVGIVAGSAVIGGVELVDSGGTNKASISAGGAVKVDASATTQPVSGTFWQATQPISAASLPLPGGAATSAKQPALGAAGAASADVLTVQGIASMTALKVDGSGVTQPVSGSVSVSNFPGTQTVSGTVTVQQSTASNLKVDISGTAANATAIKVDGSAVTQPVSGTFWQATQPVSGTITANAGTGTFTNQQSNVTADYDSGAGTQSMTMFGVALPASGGAVAGGTSSNPLKVDPTGTTTQPVSGTITANAGTGTFTIQSNASVNVNQIAGSSVATAATGIQKVGVADGSGTAITSTGGALDINIKSGGGSGFSVTDEAAWTAGTSAFVPTGGVFNDSAAALTSGQEGAIRLTNNRAIHVNLRDASANQLLGSKTSANSIPVVIASDQGTVAVSGTFWQATQPVSGTVTANAGSGTFNNQQSNITTDYDTGAGTQTMTMFGLALPASGGSVAGGTASNPVRTDPTGTTTQPVSGTVTVQQSTASNLKVDISGTGANATAIKVDGSAVTQPVSGTFWQATQPISGTVTANQGGSNWSTNVAQFGGNNVVTGTGASGSGIPRVTVSNDSQVQMIVGTSGGSTPSHVISAANNNATSLKASAGMVYGYTFSNTNAAARYVKLYNKASAPAPATDNALIVTTVQVPANATVIAAMPEGMVFGTGIAFAAVANMSDTDNTSIGAGDLSIDIRYK